MTTMRTTCTIYYNSLAGSQHTVVCEVDEQTGDHTVTHSSLTHANATTLQMRKDAEFYFGAGNVRVYTITEA